jgi:hypothetical protein
MKATYCGEEGAATPYPTQWDWSATRGYGPTRVDTLDFETFQIEGQQGKGRKMNQALFCRSMCMMIWKDSD